MPLPSRLFTGIIQEAPGSFGRHVVDLGSQGVPLIGELQKVTSTAIDEIDHYTAWLSAERYIGETFATKTGSDGLREC